MARDGAGAPGIGLGWLASVILSLVMGVLLFVTSVELRSGNLPLLPAAASLDCSTQLANLPNQIVQSTALLQAAGLPLPTPTEETKGADRLRYTYRRYEVTLPPQSLEDLKQRLHLLTERDPCVSVDVGAEEGGAHVKIGIDDVLTHTVSMQWAVPTPQRVRLAILIEDLGGDLLSARELSGLDVPLAFAVVPERPFSKEVAELAHLFQREVLLDLRSDPTSDDDAAVSAAVVARADEDAVYQALDQALASVPYAIGVKEPATLRVPNAQLVGWLKLHQLFFIGNSAAPDHETRQLAAALGIALASRGVVLDAVPDEMAVRQQLDALVKRARTSGAAIGVGHPHTSTANALRAVLPQWREAGLEIVPVSAVVQIPTLAAE